MFCFTLSIHNPFSTAKFDTVKTWYKKVSKNKAIEVGIYRSASIIGLSLGVRLGKCDHAGFYVKIELLGYNFEFEFYDGRHYEARSN